MTAPLDRLLHHADVLECGPLSWRTKAPCQSSGVRRYTGGASAGSTAEPDDNNTPDNKAVTKRPRPFVFTPGVPRGRDDRRDQELFGGLAAGGPEALAELYDRHAASLFRHAVVLTRQQPDAEDLVQAVFVKLATTGAELLGVRSPAGYLHRMIHTTWMDARRRLVAGERAAEHSATEAIRAGSAVEESIDIARALDELPPAQREVIVLHLVEGFSFREIGRSTGVSLFTAAARYRLAVGRLRKRLTAPRREMT